MNISLSTQFYLSTNPQRQEEIDFCIKQQLKEERINTYNYFFESVEALEYFRENFRKDVQARLDKVMQTDQRDLFMFIPHSLGHRPTFDDIISVINNQNKTSKSINIVCNTDIYFDALSLELLRGKLEEGEFYGLSRWDIKEDGTAELFNRPDSQDTFVWIGEAVNISAPFVMGSPGQDNKLLWLFQNAGYNVVNPSWTIKTFHLHITDFRTYVNDKGERLIPTVQPPYLTMAPVEIIIE